ncbi:MAG: cell division protein FtsA [Candidatus Omnitrophota bacterium]|nr:cell division protein FtsA [Candidatus Omnitrophota bacterium]
MKKEKIITALDVGTSKICALVAGIDSEGSIKLMAGKLIASKGISNGLIEDLSEVSDSINRALSEVEKAGQAEIYSVIVNINGPHIRSRNNQAMLKLPGLERKIKHNDIKKVTEVAASIPLGMSEKVLRVIPGRYTVDDQNGIKNPLRMTGSRLGVSVHLVTGSALQVQNMTVAVNQAGYEIEDIVPEPLACSYALLTEKEKEIGVILVNIGAATTDVIVFIEGYPVHTEIVPLGGEGLTRVVSSLLKTSPEDAETIKKRYGSVFTSRLRDHSPIMVPGINQQPSRNVSLSFLSQLIMPYTSEMIAEISKRIEASGYKEKTASGVVVTGGGTLLEGIVEMMERMLNLPVRMGCCSGIYADAGIISNPVYTTALGLVKYGMGRSNVKSHWYYDKGIFSKIISPVRSFIEEYF